MINICVILGHLAIQMRLVPKMGLNTHLQLVILKQTSLGIYDMAGNVWEWCYNWHLPYEGNPQIFPVEHNEGTKEEVFFM